MVWINSLLYTKFYPNRITHGWVIEIQKSYFPNGGRPPSCFSEYCRFGHLTYISMLFFIFAPNFALAGPEASILCGRDGPGPTQYLNWVGPVFKGPLNVLLHEQPITTASRLLRRRRILFNFIYHNWLDNKNIVKMNETHCKKTHCPASYCTQQPNWIYLSITPLPPPREEATYHGSWVISCNTNAESRCACSS